MVGLRVCLKDEMLGADYIEHGIVDFTEGMNHVCGGRRPRSTPNTSVESHLKDTSKAMPASFPLSRKFHAARIFVIPEPSSSSPQDEVESDHN